ncbi:MAG TPA: bifunctional aspartate kinase/diaminopimelate decarboxylase [Woeseiaceae bacterium]|nr:bifunctional aspartate kinase/diaminopimelate decarboxylase [Woeseiaceae bacterium]
MTSEASFESSAALGAPAPISASPWVVMKFGGTSVSTAKAWSTIAELTRNRLAEGLQAVIVHSALQGVSNALIRLLDESVSGAPANGMAGIREQHYALATDLGLNASEILDGSLNELEQLVAGVRLIREVSVRVRVRVMALGELMATRLGAAYLEQCGIEVAWEDARDMLTSTTRGGPQQDRDYLSAMCGYEADPELAKTLARSGKVILTQGFIARNHNGETVLLGRGGSDTSAAYFAARLGARRLEIWTDVPGLFSADPKLVPSARLLAALRYDEAQELASAGSTVLHPRCISPLRPHGIPLFIRSTMSPEIPGTVISPATDEVEPQVKGICVRKNITLVSLDSVGMWHEVGFLARAFAMFSDHGVSIDFVSTSETNVTVSIDTASSVVSPASLNALMMDLGTLCRARIIENCAAVSLVGRKIRTILPRLAPALKVFEEEKIHMLSQSANDLNLSFVVDSEQCEKLVGKLHSTVIRQTGGSPAFGPSWDALFRREPAPVQRTDAWWVRRREELLDIAARQLNAYVYERDSLRRSARNLKGLRSIDRVLYAVKANYNADVLKTLNEEGVDFECVSPGEVEWLEQVLPDFDIQRILFTPNFAPREEYEWALKKGLQVTLDNLHPLKHWPEIFAGSELFVRMDPGHGRGHHEHVKTAGVHSKFGVPVHEVDELRALIQGAGADVIGIHAHSGSGVSDPEAWRSVAMQLIKVAGHFPNVRAIDLGGGLGVPERPGDKAFNLARMDETLAEVKSASPDYQLWIEPGRYLVAQSGVILTHVTQLKGKRDMRYVGVATGMNSLIRPALYGAYHEIVNLSKYEQAPTDTVTVVGPICETGDRLGVDRLLPPTEEGDVILIANTGAYGYVMSSFYNRRPVAGEIVI